MNTPSIRTITIEPMGVPQILRAAADALDRLTCLRVSPPDLHRAIRQAHPAHLAGEEAVAAYYRRQAAFDALAAYMADLSGGRWLHGWTGPQSRVHIVAQVRAAAEHAETPAVVA